MDTQTQSPNRSAIPARQIRAQHDEDTITVYQAYKSSIASAAVAAQKLDASPDFKLGRMTWVKPSWNWMLYRAGYSYKDPGQECILALKMRHEHFIGLLERGVLSHGVQNDFNDNRAKSEEVRIQWDPERTARLGKLEHRSIQIGIPASLSQTWVKEWIVSIEDVTHRARELKRVLDEQPEISDEELKRLDLVPIEREFVVSAEVQERLRMT